MYSRYIRLKKVVTTCLSDIVFFFLFKDDDSNLIPSHEIQK